ncbi:aminoglycoside phosphotransferase [Sphingomonas sp. Leaf357]|uniref:APH(3')-I family aminoglycoside O-phosphotransferase n=1 Tax=Sphingomonas sp. Leaf357 TaxID=1736350 RepID=UPI0006F44C7C|nr:APH(3')-I family aminoglycoside O-phosphotransferase [Sphingomonas sp. Leaf357]KQS03229.1 aminoglycoside phosphotransferase [Sphingomonas sp. Leaf357]
MTRDQREQPVRPVKTPTVLTDLLDGYDWSRDMVGESGDAVYRLRKTGVAPDLFLKRAPAISVRDVAGEMVRLQWLRDHIAVPAVRAFFATPDEAWLLITALPGKTAYQWLESCPDQRPAIVDRLARLLRCLHAIPVASCPFNSDHQLRLGEARWRIDRGLVDVDDFDVERAGWSAEAVWVAMTEVLPMAPDPVVTHGDFSLDNILLADGAEAGCIDVGRAGVADRYQDLAILWHGLAEFGTALQRRLFDSYGIAEPDERKIRFHLMLDELF